ncbi:MAG: ferrous iron transport protein A [Halobacteriales archaeon]
MTTTLSDVSAGSEVEIRDVPDGTARARLLRLGFLDGAVECRRRLRNGPVVVRRNGTELAIGAPLAERIEVTEA